VGGAVNWLDPLVLIWVALSAVVGFGRGLVAQALSFGGLAIGAIVGARLAPLFLDGGKSSPWVPIASLVGALIGAVLLQVGGGLLGSAARQVLARGPLRLADSAGGAIVGAGVGLAVAWLAAVAALQVDRVSARGTVQDSAVLSGLVEVVPPSTVLEALARFDPLPVIAAQPDLDLPAPDPSVASSDVARRAATSVVKIHGVACGIGIQGTGWVIARGLVATNAHVVAGQDSPTVAAPNGQVIEATPVYYDASNDVAILEVRGLRPRALPLSSDPPSREPVVLLGYPNDGALTAVAGTAGQPRKVVAPDAYGKRFRLRTVVPLRGKVEHGDSGGPVIDLEGEVVAMIFAASKRGGGGFGVALDPIVKALESDLQPVGTGSCA
jgi:S1-C subfamily serine protease